MSEDNKKQGSFKKICRTFSFAFSDGYEALDWLDTIDNYDVNRGGGKSKYIIDLILKDKAETLKKRR